MIPAGLQKIFLCVLFGFSAMSMTAQTSMLPNAFSHNDYRRKRPLLDALNHGFRYVEADVYLRKGKLIVAHILPCIKKNRTLESMYLQPLLEYVERNEQSPDHDNLPLTLVIDIKSDANKTYRSLLVLLEKYKSILSGYENGQTTLRKVTIVVSGHKPSGLIHNSLSGNIFLDDNLKKIAPYSTDLYPIASCKYSRMLKWKGKGPAPAADMQRLASYVAAAHQRGRKVRLWASPENKTVWSELLKCKVDLINTNRLTSLRRFLTAATAKVFPATRPAQSHEATAVAVTLPGASRDNKGNTATNEITGAAVDAVK